MQMIDKTKLYLSYHHVVDGGLLFWVRGVGGMKWVGD